MMQRSKCFDELQKMHLSSAKPFRAIGLKLWYNPREGQAKTKTALQNTVLSIFENLNDKTGNYGGIVVEPNFLYTSR